ncbi:MAG: nuclear transport factor 2 family protein [Pyrinomonadaceae bacterium]
MNQSTEESGIREAIDHYSEGMKTANVDVLKKAFHELAVLCGYLGDELIAAPIEGLYDWVGSNPAPEGYACSTLGIEVTGRVATAKVRETDSHGDVIDHFHLLKVGDRWSIVSKIWDAEPSDE